MERQWINQRLNELGKNKAGLADHLGLAPSRITEILNARRDIKLTELPALADYLEMSVTDVLALIVPGFHDRFASRSANDAVDAPKTDVPASIQPSIDRELMKRTIDDVLGYIEATGDAVNSQEARDAIMHLYDESVEELILKDRKTILKIGGKTVDFTRNLKGA